MTRISTKVPISHTNTLGNIGGFYYYYYYYLPFISLVFFISFNLSTEKQHKIKSKDGISMWKESQLKV